MKALRFWTVWSVVMSLLVFGCDEPASTPEPVPSTPGPVNNPPSTATVTAPQTTFIASDCYATSAMAEWWVQEFTVSASRKFVLRFSSRYKADAAIVTGAEIDNFKSNRSFAGVGVLDDLSGYTLVTLAPGNYYLAVRNQNAGANAWSVELDYEIELPASDKAGFFDGYMKTTETLDPGARQWMDFAVERGYRYFIDGNNTGLQFYIIPRNEAEKFKNGLAVNIVYTEYSGNSCDLPGFKEIKVAPGNYTVAFQNPQTLPNTINFLMERWKVE